MGNVIDIVPILEARKKDKQIMADIDKAMESVRTGYYTHPTHWGCGFCGQQYAWGDIDALDHILVCSGTVL